MLPPPPESTLFPYTTLFRSRQGQHGLVTVPETEHLEVGVDGPFRGVAREGVARGAGRDHRPLPQDAQRSEEHTSELQSPYDLVCRLLLEKKKKKKNMYTVHK